MILFVYYYVVYLSFFFFFFFLMIRRPPRSTLFPTRRSSDLAQADIAPLRDPGRGSQLMRAERGSDQDRKSTRLNSSHVRISYAVFCLKKKKKNNNTINTNKKKKNKRK